MEVTCESLFDLSSRLDMDFLKSNETYLKYFYFMMPRKTCNCPNKPKVRTQEYFEEAYKLYINFNQNLNQEFKNALKNKLNVTEINFKNLNGEIIFSF